MSLSSHTLVKIVGEEVVPLGTLESLGVTRAVVTVSAVLDNDSLELTVTREMDSAGLFEPFIEHRLLDWTGAVRFIGMILEVPRTASGENETHGYRFKGGGGIHLARKTYGQVRNFADDAGDPGSGFTEGYQSNVITGFRTGVGDISARAQIEDAFRVAAALAAGIDLVADPTASAPTPAFQWDTSEVPDVHVPRSIMTNPTVPRVIGSQTRWLRRLSQFWDYSTTPPTIIFVNESETKTLTIGDVETGQALTQFGSRPRYDLFVSRMALDVQGLNSTTGFVTLTRQNSISDVTLPGGLIRGHLTHSVQLQVGESVPSDLVDELHGPFARLQYEIDWTLSGAEVSWADRPAQSWNVLGAGTELETALSLCQSITRDIGAGTTSYKCAPLTPGAGDSDRASKTQRAEPGAGDGFDDGSDGGARGVEVLVTGAISGAPAKFTAYGKSGWEAI